MIQFMIPVIEFLNFICGMIVIIFLLFVTTSANMLDDDNSKTLSHHHPSLQSCILQTLQASPDQDHQKPGRFYPNIWGGSV